MSSYVWMKVLESAPERYDRGIRMLSGGHIDDVYQRIAETAVTAAGQRVLDIGCGTGGVSLACAARGARVTGIDIDSGMLEVARGKSVPESGSVEWLQLGVAEIEDRFGEQSLDAVVSCLAMSELSEDEQNYALTTAFRRLMVGGRLVIGDETLPRGWWRRLAYRLRRLPLAVVAYVLTQTTTRPVRQLSARVRAAGFQGVSETRLWSDAFVITEAVRGESPP